jgi:hypothetical protein
MIRVDPRIEFLKCGSEVMYGKSCMFLFDQARQKNTRIARMLSCFREFKISKPFRKKDRVLKSEGPLRQAKEKFHLFVYQSEDINKGVNIKNT